MWDIVSIHLPYRYQVALAALRQTVVLRVDRYANVASAQRVSTFEPVHYTGRYKPCSCNVNWSDQLCVQTVK